MGNLSCKGIGEGVFEHGKQPEPKSKSCRKGGRGLRRALSSSSASSVESRTSTSSSSSSSSSNRKSKKSLIREASVEILPPSEDGITRVKLVISKQQVDGIVSGDYSGSARLDFFDNLVTSLLKQELQSCR